MYKIKKNVELPKEFKIMVNQEQSKALQEYLFSIGVTWIGGSTKVDGTKVDDTDKPYIYVHRFTFSFGTQEHTYDNNFRYLQKIQFQDYFEPSFPEKWCIEVTEDNFEELREWMYINSGNYAGYATTWMMYKGISISGRTLFSHTSSGVWYQPDKNVFYEEITTEQFRGKFGVEPSSNITGANCDHIVKSVNNLGRAVSELGGGEAFCKDADNVIKLDRPKPEWQMSDEAQIVFNILYKKGIKFDNNDFEVYLRMFEEGVNFEQQKNKLS